MGTTLLGAVLLVSSEFTTLFTVKVAGSAAPISSVRTASHDSYALIPIALVAVALAYAAVRKGGRPALFGLGALGVAALLIALIGDLPDAQATGTVGSAITGFRQASATPGAGLYLETLGAIALVIAAGCGLLLSDRSDTLPAALPRVSRPRPDH
jgi:hypothetical protein